MHPLLLFLFLLLPTIPATRFPHGLINPLLHTQALSHLAFHSAPLKLTLASLFPQTPAVAVVGVEWGEEVAAFARAGHRVYAFEPARKYVAHLETLLADNPRWNVTVVPVAAGAARGGSVVVEYENGGVRERVLRGVVDDYVTEMLAVLSVDVQGGELDVLRGCEDVLGRVGVLSLWVEAIACNAKVAELLQLLDGEYVIFDFVPWGLHVAEAADGVPRSLRSFAFDPQRPSEFAKFLEWMCRRRESAYRWLQTDFLAVRRDVLTDNVLVELGDLADRSCGAANGAADCVLRDLLLSDFDKDEL